MHLQIIVRGIRPLVDLWINAVEQQYFKWDRVNQQTGETEKKLIAGGVRPSVLGTYEIIIPEAALPTILSMMMLDEKNLGVKPSFMYKTRLAFLRRMCGVKKIPRRIWKEAAKIPHSITINDSERGLSHLSIQNIAIHIIGIKKDKYGIYDGAEEEGTFYQEML